MRIIKKGIPKKDETVYVFTCSSCKSQIEVCQNELGKPKRLLNDIWFEIACPVCLKFNSIDEKDKINSLPIEIYFPWP